MKYRDLKTLSARQLIRERKERGFTLIELVIVLAVLGVLAAIGIPQLTGLQDQAELQGAATNAASEISNVFARDLAAGLNGTSGSISEVDWNGGCEEINTANVDIPALEDFALADDGGGGNDAVTISIPQVDDDGDIADSIECDFVDT